MCSVRIPTPPPVCRTVFNLRWRPTRTASSESESIRTSNPLQSALAPAAQHVHLGDNFVPKVGDPSLPAPRALALTGNPQIVTVLVGVGLLARRRLFLRAALHGVAEDAARLDARWRQLTEDPAAADDLARLAATADAIAASASGYRQVGCGGPARQLQRASSIPDAGTNSCRPASMCGVTVRLFRARPRDEEAYSRTSLPGVPDPARPTGSLDQLYSQALGATPLLRAACGRWAAGSGGALDTADQRGAAAKAPEGYGAAVAGEAFRHLKDPARAVEKVVTCYGGDASRLLDVCRCRIAFGSVADLVHCLELARADEGVEIVRVRNWMRLGSDAGAIGGFRVSS